MYHIRIKCLSPNYQRTRETKEPGSWWGRDRNDQQTNEMINAKITRISKNLREGGEVETQRPQTGGGGDGGTGNG